jgi:hypothetical protein
VGIIETASMIYRKFVTTFVTTMTICFIFAFIGAVQGEHFLGWFIIYIMYVGTIVLLFGNLVSFVVEYLSKNYFSLYILLHGVFGGLALGIPFKNMEAALVGIGSALLYGCIDRWLYKRTEKYKSTKMFFLVPIMLFLISWAFFAIFS